MALTISVVLLTQNRATLLAGCLEALVAQTRPADEIVVVDNGSTDETPEILSRFADRLPLRVVAGTSAGGWAAARNRGVREAAGEWIAFTDDDCIPAPDWLDQLAESAANGWDAIGGLVEPLDPPPVRFWWHPEMAWAAGLSVPGLRGPLAGSVYYAQTANLAVRRAILLTERFQEIPADFARDANLYLSGREDAELWQRLRRHGYRTRIDAQFVVQHRIPPERYRFGQVAKRAFLDGMALQRREPARELVERAMDVLVGLPGQLVCAIWRGPESPWREAAWRILWAIRQAGQCVQARRRKGAIRGTAMLAGMAARNMQRRSLGLAKAAARRAGILCLRILRPRRNASPHARSIVIAADAYLGDLALLYPLVSALRMQRPDATITLLTNSKGEELFRHSPSLDCIIVPTEGADPLGSADAVARAALRRARADLVLVPYFYSHYAPALFSRRRARVVTFSDEVGFSRRWWYDRADKLVAKTPGRPEAENLYRLFHEAGLSGKIPHAPLAFTPREVDETNDFLRGLGLNEDNLVLLAPGSAKKNKFWPEERWAAILRYLVDEYRLHVAMAPAPAEEAMCRRIAGAAGCPAHVWCNISPRRLAQLIAKCRLLVGTDNGCKHLAVAVDTPSVTLFGPTDERQWGALREPHRHMVVRACTWDLTDEERIGLPPNHQMACITTELVIRALDEMLAER